MANLRVFLLKRTGRKGLIVYNVDGGAMIEKEFPASMTDGEVLASIGVEQKTPAVSIPANPVEDEPPKHEEKPVETKKNVNEQMETKRELKARYIAELKAKGIDKSKEPSFARIEAAWKKHCC